MLISPFHCVIPHNNASNSTESNSKMLFCLGCDQYFSELAFCATACLFPFSGFYQLLHLDKKGESLKTPSTVFLLVICYIWRQLTVMLIISFPRRRMSIICWELHVYYFLVFMHHLTYKHDIYPSSNLQKAVHCIPHSLHWAELPSL